MAKRVQTALRDTISVKQLTQAPQDDGTVTEGEVDLGTRLARVSLLTGQRAFEHQQVHPKATVEVVLRRIPALAPGTHWFEFGSRRLNILHVSDPQPHHHFMTVLCGEDR